MQFYYIFTGPFTEKTTIKVYVNTGHISQMYFSCVTNTLRDN